MSQNWVGVAMPFWGASWVPVEHKVAWTETTSIPSGILVHPAVWPQRTLTENWGLCTFRGGGAGSTSNVTYAEAYLRAK